MPERRMYLRKLTQYSFGALLYCRLLLFVVYKLYILGRGLVIVVIVVMVALAKQATGPRFSTICSRLVP